MKKSKLFGRAPQAGGKIGMTDLGSRSVAEAPAPGITVGAGANRTQAYTYFTKIPVSGEPTPIIYNGDRLWARVTLTLETAGPVSVGDKASLSPVLSGKGELLETDVPMTFNIAKGTRLFILATSVNRVKVLIEPVPWLEQITALISSMVGRAFGRVST